MEFNITTARNKKDLIDRMLNCKLNSKEFMNYEIVLTRFTDLVNRICTQQTGYVLFSITNNFRINIHLICVNAESEYTVYSWSELKKIEQPITFEIYKEDHTDNLTETIKALRESTKLSTEEIVGLMLSKTLTGYSLNKNNAKEYMAFIKTKSDDLNIDKKDLEEKWAQHQNILDQINTIKKEEENAIKQQLEAYSKSLECKDLILKFKTTTFSKYNLVGYISDVREIGNKRTFRIDILLEQEDKKYSLRSRVYTTTPDKYDTLSISKLGDLYIANGRKDYYDNGFILDSLSRIPYNYIDVGRYIVIVNVTHDSEWKLIIGADPNVEQNPQDILIDVIRRYAKYLALNNTNVDDSYILNTSDKHQLFSLRPYLASVKRNLSSEEVREKGIRVHMQALKKMVNEYNYLSKKSLATGEDVFITDKIKYNHANGKISYGDFSIACDHGLIKTSLYKQFKGYLIEFYRGEITEETILDRILSVFFTELTGVINKVSSGNETITLFINDVISVTIKMISSKNGASLLYINDKRFNKNEVITVLKEITCYRDKTEAQRFIENIGRVGLSVYIGITTGYEVDNKIYKFKKEKGRSEYKLCLDDIEIDIKGKRIISSLYDNFLNRTKSHASEMDKRIFDCTKNTLDYLRYKFLIDSSYETFKKKSQEFLDKKVSDVNGEYCTYKSENRRTTFDAIKLTGMSGNTYILAYNNKESFVFMSPEKDEESGHYKNGKYICMIDQSNIKSNVGYDTVISKLLALKNDSMIAGTIYNLKEELESDE